MIQEPVITDAYQTLTTTRAVRRRLDLERPVDRSVIEQCVSIATQAPSGGNRRGFRFVVVDDPIVRRDIAAIYWRAFEMYRTGPTVATKAFVGDTDKSRIQDRVFTSVEHLARTLADVPCIVIPCAPGRWDTKEGTRGQAGFWGSVFPAIWSFQLACRTYGLGTALTTMHLEFERDAADVLGIPFDDYTQVGLLPVAHTIGLEFKAAEREEPDNFIHWDRWSPTAGADS